MSTKAVSRICGILYVTTVLAFLVNNLLIKEQLVDAASISNTLAQVAAHAFCYRRCYTLSEVPEALRYLGTGHARGKVVIVM